MKTASQKPEIANTLAKAEREGMGSHEVAFGEGLKSRFSILNALIVAVIVVTIVGSKYSEGEDSRAMEKGNTGELSNIVSAASVEAHFGAPEGRMAEDMLSMAAGVMDEDPEFQLSSEWIVRDTERLSQAALLESRPEGDALNRLIQEYQSQLPPTSPSSKTKARLRAEIQVQRQLLKAANTIPFEIKTDSGLSPR